MMKCKNAESLLTKYLLGDLDIEQASEVRAHLEGCGNCRAVAEEIQPTLDLLRDALAETVPAPARLDAEHHAGIFAPAVSEKGAMVQWFLEEHPFIRKAAAGLVVCLLLGAIAGLMLPAGAKRRAAVQCMILEPEELEESAESAGEAGSISGPDEDSDGSHMPFSEPVSGAAADGYTKDYRFTAPAMPGPEEVEPADISSESPYAAPSAPTSPMPAAFDSAAAVKSPVVMRGVYGSRSAGAREYALAKAGGKAAAEADAADKEAYKKRERGILSDLDMPAEAKEENGSEQELRENKASLKPKRASKESMAKHTDEPAGIAMDSLEGHPAEPADRSDVNGSVVGFGTEGADRAEQPVPGGLPVVGRLFLKDDAAMSRPGRQESQTEKPGEDTGRSNFEAYGINPVINVAENSLSTFSIDIDTTAYTLTRNYIESGSLPPAAAVRTEEIVNYFDYDYKAPAGKVFAVYAEMAPSKFGQGRQLLKIGIKGRRLGREEERKAALTFLIDTSGSMEQQSRIGLVKESLKLLVGRLRGEDIVSVIQYDSHARLVLSPTPAAEAEKIISAVDSLQCSGSTNLEEGMEKAYELAAKSFVSKGENRVLIFSDGAANLGSLDAETLLAKVQKYRKQGIFCSVFGVGRGTYDDVMLEQLANRGDGAYAFLDNLDEAKRLFVDDLSATLNTIAGDVKIQVEFSSGQVASYRQIGYENRQLTKEQFRDDEVDAGEVGSGQSVTALYELEMQKRAARQRPDEPIAIVRVRYRAAGSGAVEEVEVPVTMRHAVRDFNRADARFRLAACAAEFAEILRDSPYASGSEFRDVSDVLAPVALELNLDQRVQEFLRLVTAAQGMTRREQ